MILYFEGFVIVLSNGPTYRIPPATPKILLLNIQSILTGLIVQLYKLFDLFDTMYL